MRQVSSQIYLRSFCCPILDSQPGCKKGTEPLLWDTSASNPCFCPHLVGSYSQGLYIMNLISKFKSVSEAGDTEWKTKPGNFPAFINILTKVDRPLFLSDFLSCRITKRSSTVPCCHWHISYTPLESRTELYFDSSFHRKQRNKEIYTEKPGPEGLITQRLSNAGTSQSLSLQFWSAFHERESSTSISNPRAG